MDSGELTVALRNFQQLAVTSKEMRERSLDRLAFLHKRAAKVHTVVAITVESEQAARYMQEINEGSLSLVGPRVGGVLFKTSTRINEMVNKWESTNGEVNKEQFRHNLRSMMIGADTSFTDSELDSLFDRFDADLGGTLDLKELKTALANMKEEANDYEVEQRLQQKNVKEALARAKAAQTELHIIRKEDTLLDHVRASEEAAEREAANEAARMHEANKEAAKQAKRKKLEEKAALMAMRR